MSAKPKKQPDTRLIKEYESAPLDKGQRGRLHMLGWKDVDIVEMTVSEAHAILKTGSKKLGSAAAMKDIAKQTGAPDLSRQYSDEAIAEREASRPESSGVQVTRDEFTNQCLQASTENFVMDEYRGRVIKGSDPLNGMLLEMEERYCHYEDGVDKDGKAIKVRIPTRRFRWSHPNDPAEVGPAPEPVYDAKTGKPVMNGELFMVWMPVDVWQEGRQEPQLARSRAMTGAIERNRGDLMRSNDEMGPVIEGQLQMGKSEANYPA